MTVTRTLLNESSAIPLVKEGAGFKAVMITPGKGSSGTYSEDVLRRDAATAFPPGTTSYIDHPTEANPGRNPKDLFGTFPDGGHYEEGVGIVGTFVPMPHWKDFAEAVAPHTALSIYAMGESDVNGNIKALLPDVQNTVDLVSFPGRPGSGLTQMYEAAHAVSETRTATSVVEEKKETKMTPEQEAKLDALATLVGSFVAESMAAAVALVKESVDTEAAVEAADVRVKATIVALEAVNKADLPDVLRAGLVSTIESGNTDVTPLIESAIALHESIKASFKSETVAVRGHVVSETASSESNAASFDALFAKAV